MNSPSTALGMKCHGSFLLVTIVSCCEHSQIKLYFVETPSAWAQEKNINKFVLILKEFSSYLCNQHPGFSCNFSYSLGKTKPLPWPFQWTFCLETPKLWLYLEPEGASSGLCLAGCPGTWGLEKKWWIGQKKTKQKRKPKNEIKCHFYFLSQRSP